jgi:hypothetical protein
MPVRPSLRARRSGSVSARWNEPSLAPSSTGDTGTFVWADSQVADFVASGPNQFLIRAQNGAAINNNTPQNSAALTLSSSSNTTGALAVGAQIRRMVNLLGANPNGPGSE